MKKLLFIMVLVMGALLVNAQRTPVRITDLQKSITDNIAKDYSGFIIKEATKDVEKNIVTYNVVVAKGAMTETLCYDSSGKFLKKMESKSGMVRSETKPTAMPARMKH